MGFFSKLLKSSSKSKPSQSATEPPTKKEKVVDEAKEEVPTKSSANREQTINIHSKHKAQRAQNVFAQPIDMSADYVAPRYPKSADAVRFIDNALADNFIFASLTIEERIHMINAMKATSVEAGTSIITQGDIGDYFYVVEEGSVTFTVDGNHVGGCSTGATFGELALLYDCPRAATCLANTDCKLWSVDQRTFRQLLANSNASQQKDTVDVLRKVKFLADLEDDAMLIKIADALATLKFNKGDKIINKGDVGEVFYIVKDGSVKVHDIGFGDSQFVDQTLGPGDFFGERALLTGEPRAADITAEVDSVCLCLSREEFEKSLGSLQGLIDRATEKRVLMAVPLFANSQFEPHEMARLTELVEEVDFKQGDEIAVEGKATKKGLYIIRKGKITVVNENGMISTLSPGDYFGETLIKADGGAESKQTITAEEASTCGVLTQSAIESVIGDITRLGKALPPVASKLDRTIKFDELQKLRILGVGTFGKVWLVNHKKTKKSYALKMLSKREIIGHHQVEGVMREKNIMASIDHPFVVDLRCTFQDDQHLYLLIQICQGGELFTVIHTDTSDYIPNASAVFYAACVLESLSTLHQRRVAYRDLKPENLLIDSEGYCVLVDLGFAKVVTDKTYTLCGTPEYLAPEIILSKGHDKGVDYWAFGILIYEMLVGSTPFMSYGLDQMSLFKRIVKAKYTFPNMVTVNDDAQDLIQRLLVTRQSNRFGSLAGADKDVRDHPWLKSINTEELLKKKIPAPWVPKIKDSLDSQYFDSYKHIENEMTVKKPPLSKRQQELFKDF